MSPLEKETERKVADYARLKRDCLAIKLTIWGRRGWPDYLLIHYGKILFIEFKREGEKAGKLQEYIHGLIRKHSFRIEVVDTEADGRRIVDLFTQDSPHIQ